MMQLVAYVSGKVQKVGYRARVVQIANALKIKGMIENLDDGRVKIVAEGEEKALEYFEDAIDIKNTLISVEYIEQKYLQASGNFTSFYKLVEPGEPESRLDEGIDILRDILTSINNINANLSSMNANLGCKMDKMLKQQGEMLKQQDTSIGLLKCINKDTSSIKEDTSSMKDDLSQVSQELAGNGGEDNLREKVDNLSQDVSEIKATLAEVKARVDAR